MTETEIKKVSKGVLRFNETGVVRQMNVRKIENLSITASKHDFENVVTLLENFKRNYTITLKKFYIYSIFHLSLEYLNEMETHTFLYVDNVERSLDKTLLSHSAN